MVLVMTLMAICLVLMMVHALYATTGLGLNATASFYDREAALQAAQSGMDYAVTRLQHHRSWRGDSNCKYWNNDEKDSVVYCAGKLESTGVVVAESFGNVVGLIRARDGAKSAFRIKFNYEDTSIDKDKIPCSFFVKSDGTNPVNPVDNLKIKMPYVSINNLNRDEAAKVYRAKASGEGIAAKAENLERSDDSALERDFSNYVPPQRVAIIVEGLAGKCLRDCTTPEEVRGYVDGNLWNGNGGVARRYVEAYYTFNAPVLNGNAAFAHKDLEVQVAKTMYVRSAGYDDNHSAFVLPTNADNVAGQMRSDQAINITEGGLQTYNGKLLFKTGAHYNSVAGDKPSEEVSSGVVQNVAWGNVAKADNVKSNVMTPGFYQWDVKDGGYELRYFPDGFKADTANRDVPVPIYPDKYKVVTDEVIAEDDTKHINIGPIGKVAFTKNAEGRITQPVLHLKGKLYCPVGDNAVDNQALVICCNQDTVASDTPMISFSSYLKPGCSEEDAEDAVLTGGGKLTLLSSVIGAGAIVSQDDVSIVGSSMLHSGENAVAIYGKNVTINSFDRMMKNPTDGSAWGDPYGGASRRNMPASGANSLYEGLATADDQKTSIENYFLDSHGIMINPTEIAYVEDIRNVELKRAVQVPIGGALGGFLGGIGSLIGDPSLGYRTEYVSYDPKRYQEVDSSYYTVDFKFRSDSDTNAYRMKIKAGGEVDYYFSEQCGSNGDRIGNFQAPADAWTPTDPKQRLYQTAYGPIVYGDTVIDGIIYATENFRMDLGPKFKCIVRGAVRAEKGEIKASCGFCDITYDESYLERLMPNVCSLTRELWNCW